MKNYNADIGAFLAKNRKTRGMTQSDIASALGVSTVAVHYWENGSRTIDANTMFAYCDILNIPPQDLVDAITKEKG